MVSDAVNRLFRNINIKLDNIQTSNSKIENSINSLTGNLGKPECRTITISDKLALTRLFNDMSIYLDPQDVAVAPHIMFEGVWEAEQTKAWMSVLDSGQTIFDVGANFGYYGILAAGVRFKINQKVYFFEANPDLIPLITKSLSVNGVHKICKIENCGIDEKKGHAKLTVLHDFVGCSSLHSTSHLEGYLQDRMPIQAEKIINIQTISLDDYCSENKIKKVDLIKLDIEGYEERAYRGMTLIVKNSPSLILFIEFTRLSYVDPIEFYKRLRKDFNYLYLINSEGGLYQPESCEYDDLIGNSEEYKMLVFSKKSI